MIPDCFQNGQDVLLKTDDSLVLPCCDPLFPPDFVSRLAGFEMRPPSCSAASQAFRAEVPFPTLSDGAPDLVFQFNIPFRGRNFPGKLLVVQYPMPAVIIMRWFRTAQFPFRE